MGEKLESEEERRGINRVRKKRLIRKQGERRRVKEVRDRKEWLGKDGERG